MRYLSLNGDKSSAEIYSRVPEVFFLNYMKNNMNYVYIKNKMNYHY